MTPLTRLAHRYGTPLYVYRRDRLRRAADDLRAALPDSRLYYSVKANPNPDVVAELVRAGLDAEVSSTGELHSAVAAGTPGARCLYTGPGKTWDDLCTAIRHGVRLFSVESVADHERLVRAADAGGVDVEYLVRLNGAGAAGSGLRMTGRASQFGVDVEQSTAIASMLSRTGRATPIGIHVFATTNVVDEDALIKEFDLSAAAAADALALSVAPPRLVDLGGGFAAPFARPGERPQYGRLRTALEGILDHRLPGWRVGEPRVAFESGRYLVADSGTLLTTILDVKHSRGTTYVILDAGINALGGIWGLGRLLTPSAQPAPDPTPDPAVDPAVDPVPPVTLVGPLCTPLDVLARSARMPEPRVGAVVEIPNVGAYGLTASLVGFLSRPVPTELVVDADGEVVSVRRLELRATTARESGETLEVPRAPAHR